MCALDFSHKIIPRKVIFAQIKKNFLEVLLQSLPLPFNSHIMQIFSDSFENDINDTATIEAARRLETIVPVFMGVGIGDEGSMNMENLTALLGNKTQYAYDNITDAYNVSFGVSAEIAMAYPCAAIGIFKRIQILLPFIYIIILCSFLLKF
jgi:hypothetical protein